VLESVPAELAQALEAQPDRDARAHRVVDQYEVVTVLERDRRRVTVEVADLGDRIPRTLSLRRSRGGRRMVVGAPAFDRALELSAPEPWALAVFKQSTRTLAQVMVERWGALIESGLVKLVHASGSRTHDADVLRTVMAAMDLSRALSIAAEQIPEALATNAAEDPEPNFRLRALSVLVEEFPDRSLDACRRALTDPEPASRLVAALTLPPDPTVEGVLANLATSWAITGDIRVDAFERFLEVAAEPIPVLERALADPVLAERAVHATVRFSDPGWTDFLADVAADCDVRLRTAIALVLSELRHPRAEALLLAVPLGAQAIDRLGEMGTVRALPVLKQVGSKEARAAIERIKARVGNVEGHVALVDDEDRGGALSEADSGRVSLSRDQEE
jgi:hypothetical protein